MEELEYTQCTAFALVVGMIVGAAFVSMAAEAGKSYRTGFATMFAMPLVSVFAVFALVLIIGIGDTFAKNPVAAILALALLFGVGSGVTGVVVIIM